MSINLATYRPKHPEQFERGHDCHVYRGLVLSRVPDPWRWVVEGMNVRTKMATLAYIDCLLDGDAEGMAFIEMDYQCVLMK